MISSTDSCRRLVAGNYDVILDEPTTFKTVLTDFLERCEQYENELIIQQAQQHEQQGQETIPILGNQQVNTTDNNNDQKNPPANPSAPGYVNEFKMLKELSRVLKKDTSTYLDGLEHYNRSKNRYSDIIPFNHTRVILSSNPPHYELPGRRNDQTHDQQQQQQQKQPKHKQLGRDYINANYIRGPSGSPQAYIASQGPLPSTLNDFWRMIWECNVSVIVMACNEHELGLSKCEPYWPEQLETNQVYGNIRVTLMRVRQVNSDFLIRKFLVQYLADPEMPEQQQQGDDPINGVSSVPPASTTNSTNSTSSNCNHTNRDANSIASSESISASEDSTATSSTTTINTNTNHDRPIPPHAATIERRVLLEKSVVQFHISSWPDHGVPDSVQPILELVRLVREVQPFEQTPILVHCSAGCGRTGTICCIDYVYGLMRMGKLDSSFDLFTIISEMRRQRMAMVQTLEQYILCHRAVASLFMQQLELLGHSTYQNNSNNNNNNDNRHAAVCDAKLALAAGSTATGNTAATGTNGVEKPEDDHLDTSNETSENSYKLYRHETSSSTDEQRTNSDFQEDEDDEEEEDLGPVFI